MTASVASATERGGLSEKFQLCRPEELPGPKEIYARVARRAYELFELRGCNPGHEWEDWFRAESELLRPVPIEIEEKADRIIVHATVVGFEATELKACVESSLLTIAGKKKLVLEDGEKMFYVEWAPDEIYRIVNLPSEVTPESAAARLHSGMLEFMLPRKSQTR